jgi:Mce-associated membrane protein
MMKNQYLLYVSIGLVVIAAGFAAFFGISWANTDTEVARAREEVSTVGAAAVATLTSLDYNNVDQVYQRFLDVSTGEVHADYAKNQDAFKKRIRDSKVVTTAAVRETAVTEVNLQTKTAAILVVVDTTVKESEKDPTTKRLRIEAALDQTDNGWKVKVLRQVPYSAAGAQ